MEGIISEIVKALSYILISGVVFAAYWTANQSAKGTKGSILLKGLLWCAGIAFFGSMILGDPTCEGKSDDVYGGCNRYADDGFTPTTEQRIEKFAYYMTLLYVPVVIGALNKKQESSDERV